MSWAGLANNQTVSFNNLQNAVNTSVFTAKTTIPVSTEQITKTDADTYVNIDTSYAPYAAKAANQLVVKSDLIAASSTTTTTTTSTTTAAPTTSTTTTTTTAIIYDYYTATQYLNCVQNSSVSAYVIRVPSNVAYNSWFCGDDGYQYEVTGETSAAYDITAVSSANSCGNLSC